jgi:hypothetical protein
MCEYVVGSAESLQGCVRKLCNPTKSVQCILDDYLPLVELRPAEESPDAETSGEEPTTSMNSPRATLEAFCSLATHVVLEQFYFDLDSRSEHAMTVAGRFDDANITATTRLHFVVSTEAPGSKQSLRGFAANVNSIDYLGYMIVRQQAYGTVGRTLVPAHIDPALLTRSADVNRLVKIQAVEHVQLFGVHHSACGIPFMEQDGHLLRCAHVSVWICHYAAYLRGQTSRRATGFIHKAGNTPPLSVRRYPSAGLNQDAIHHVLEQVDLPPEVVDKELLVKRRRFTWADRRELVEVGQELEKELKEVKEARAQLPRPTTMEQEWEEYRAERLVKDAASKRDLFWIREHLASLIARYLNSGIPSILLRKAKNHTQVAVGYLRNMDRRERAKDATETAVTAVIVADDVKGPFTIVEIEDLASEVLDGKLSVLTPLPRSIWVSGGAAETFAISWLSRAAKQVSDLFKSSSPFAEVILAADSEAAYTVRTYLISSAQLKSEIAYRWASEIEMVDRICQMQLPKYVWMCEAVDRKAREDPDAACVAALLCLDATIPEVDRAFPHDATPLFVRVPGGFRTYELVGRNVQQQTSRGPGRSRKIPPRDQTWIRCSDDLLAAGRWNSTLEHPTSSDYMNYRQKLADPIS